MKVTLLSIIKQGTKTTRYMIKYKGNYASVKLENNECYSQGMEVDILESIIDLKFKEQWKQKNSWYIKKEKF